MNKKYGTKWSREETILAMELYCRTPFNKIGKNNKEIIKLAELIGRTPSSVGLKLSNIAHFDPEIRARELSGMGNASKLDSEIFNEFHMNMNKLSMEALRIKESLFGTSSNIGEGDLIEKGYDAKALLTRRVGQDRFREYVLASYRTQCCITALSEASLLLASHIKPWKDSDDLTEKTNPCNGLCLNPLHDRAFDKGYMTIDKSYHVVLSERLKEIAMDDNTREWISKYNGMQIHLPDKFYPDKNFIEYHNDVVFNHF